MSCDGNSDCGSGETCCDLGKNSVGTCNKFCVGKSCENLPWYLRPWYPRYRYCALGEQCCGVNKKCHQSCYGEDCLSNDDCGTTGTCCDRAKGSGKCATFCDGKTCKYDSDCATPEYCCGLNGTCTFKCIVEACTSNYHCDTGKACCDRAIGTGKCATSCIGKSCKYDSDCPTHECCCDRAKPKGIGKCATSCIRKSCKYSSHCASHEYCCSLNGICTLNIIGEVCLSDNDCAP